MSIEPYEPLPKYRLYGRGNQSTMSNLSQEWHPRGSLTEREMQVLSEISTGKSLREVSRSLVISENTVKNHVRNIIEKLRLFHGGLDS